MNRKARTHTLIGLLLLIALVIGATNAQGQSTLKETEKIEELQQHAEQGDAESQFRLGYAYQFGRGVDQDSMQATHWWKKAAEQGYPEAQFVLGLAYNMGEGIEQDPTQAAHWFRKAAEQGHRTSQRELGFAYERGMGVQQDLIEAYAWYSIGKQNRARNFVTRNLTLAQLDQAEQRAKELQKQIQANIAERDQPN